MNTDMGAERAIVLVEGVSDQLALETLAKRRGLDLASVGVAIVPIGGAPAIESFVARFRPQGVSLAGLCDAGEEPLFRRALERGVFVCVEDLEDELIRSLGAATVERLIDAQGDLGPFRTLQKQPHWQDQPLAAQLRRFLGSAGGRKIAYAPLLVNALDLTRVPRALDGVLDHVTPSP